jgi:UDP-N-acetylmuramyl pentapeptide phosphotransferase/UDP-N-acetylglucosamine-1-phosphate transferase
MIEQLIIPVTLLLIAGICSLVLTPLARTLMTRLGAVDQPDERRVNRVPIPRGGGLAVIVSFFLTLGVAYFVWPTELAASPFYPLLPWFSGAAVILLATGLADDLRGLPAIVKLVAQIAAALLLCYGGARFLLPTAWGAWVLSPWVYVPLTLVWYIGVINAFNLIDGLDGLSSGLAIIATAGLAGVLFVVSPGSMPVVCFIVIGALLGFLRYNYHPATVFMGDTGSLFLGLLLATIALATRREDAFVLTMGFALLCIGMPLIDTTLAILRRTLRYILRRLEGDAGKGGIMVADRSHVHHRLLTWSRGNQRLAVWGLYGLAMALVALGFLSLCLRMSQATVFLIGFFAFAAVIFRAMTDVELWDAGRLITRPGARNGSRLITVPCYVLADCLIMAGSFALLAVLGQRWMPELSRAEWINLFLWYAVPVMVALVLVKAYTRIWGRSTRRDEFLIVLAIGGGSLVSHLLVSYILPGVAPRAVLFHLVWALILPLPLIMVRLIKTIFVQWLTASENRRLCKQSLADASIARVLFYGAGMNLRAYITLCEANVTRNNVALLGVLDDNPGLRGRVFRDLPILGPLEVLNDEAVFNQLRPTQIIVTTPTVGEARLADIRAFCREHGLTLSRCAITEETLAL